MCRFGVPIVPVYADVVAGNEVVAPVQVAPPLPLAFYLVLPVGCFGCGMGRCDIVEECGVSSRTEFGRAG